MGSVDTFVFTFSMLLYHLVPRGVWLTCKRENKAYYPATYTQDGFTHLSDNYQVLLTIGNHFYTDIVGDFIVLEISQEKLKDEVKFEAAAPVGDKATFDA